MSRVEGQEYEARYAASEQSAFRGYGVSSRTTKVKGRMRTLLGAMEM